MVVWQCQISLKAVSKKHNNTNTNTNNDININNGVINKNHNNIIIVTANFLGDFL